MLALLFAALVLPWLTFTELKLDVTDAAQALCRSGPVLILELQHGNYVGYVGDSKSVFVLAKNKEPVHLFYGIDKGDAINIVKDEPFNPAKHRSPCDWIDKEPSITT